MGVTIEHYRARIGCHNIKNTCTSIQESPFLSGRFLIKGWCYFIYTCFWWLCYNHSGCRSNGHFDYHILAHCRWYSIPTSANMFLSIPRMALRWLYMVMLFLLQQTQLSSQLSFVNKNIYNQTFPNQLYFQRKSHKVCYIQSCYIAELYRASNNFRLSSGRHVHAWRAYFFLLLLVNCHFNFIEEIFSLIKVRRLRLRSN